MDSLLEDGKRFAAARFCHWCGAGFSREPRSLRYKTREHLVPRSLGGTLQDGNLVAACRACNQKRGTDTAWRPYQWRRRKAERCGSEA